MAANVLMKDGMALDSTYTLEDLATGFESNFMAASGRWMIQEVDLDDGIAASIDAALLIDLADQVTPEGPASPMARGYNDFTFAHAAPGNRVVLVAGPRAGTTNASCGGTPVEVDIDKPRVLGVSVAGADGTGMVSFAIPAALSGRTIVLQAVDLDACAVGFTSEVSFP